MLEILTLNIADIIPYANAPKEHPPEQVEQIAESIREYKMNDPIAVDENNVIIEGHGRFLALKQMGELTAPCIRLSHLTEAQKRAYSIAHNKLTLNSGFDIEKLRAEFSFLEETEFGLLGTGFTADELAEIFGGGADGAKEAQEDNFDVGAELEKPCFSRLGDVWELGGHRLICGDCTDGAVTAALMNGNAANLVVTDPPYNVDYQGATKDHLKIQNDKQKDGDFRAFLLAAFANIFKEMLPGAAAYIFHADSEGLNFRWAFKEAGFELKQCLIWVKNQFVLGRQDYQWRHEPILYGWKGGGSHYFVNDRTQTTVTEEEFPDLDKLKKPELLSFIKDYIGRQEAHATTIYENKPLRNADHPTMKPVTLCGRLITNSSKSGWVVLDPFGGSGSTLIACEQTGRVCYTAELEPKYCDVIVKRYIEQLKSADGIFVTRNGERLSYDSLINVSNLDTTQTEKQTEGGANGENEPV